MKKNSNKTLKVASLMMGVTVIAASLVSGTYAKYTSSVTASDTATVAKWSIEVNDTEIATNSPATVLFDLFNTIEDTAAGGGTETDVKEGLIAPGTTGSFALKIENLSEVTAKYKIELTETNDNDIPIEYRRGASGTWGSLADIGIEEEILNKESGTATETIYWRWAFIGTESATFTSSQNDGSDTALGIMAAQATAPTIKVEATITVEQVN